MVPIADLDKVRKNATSEQEKEMREQWTTWMEAHQANIVEEGTPVGKNKRVGKNGIQDMRNDVTGYTIVEAETHDDAAKMFEDNPMLVTPTAYIDVLEYVDMNNS